MARNTLRGRTALITGAAQRIGRQIALTLADEGANIVAHYRHSTQQAGQLCDDLRQRGVQAWPVAADLSQPEQAETLLERARAAAGNIDMLVNNASIFPAGHLADLTFRGLSDNLTVNAWAPFVLSRALARLGGRGRIVNLLDARLAGHDQAHVGYFLSKHVLAVLTRLMALGFAPDITVNAVAPGLILPPPGQDQTYLDRLTHLVPLRRHGDPQDIADAVLFLLKSDFITGQVIYVDGGRHLREYPDGSHPH